MNTISLLGLLSFASVFALGCNDSGIDATVEAKSGDPGGSSSSTSGAGGSVQSESNKACETLACGDHAECTGSAKGLACVCLTGFEGDGKTCTDIDECSAGLAGCHEKSTCVNHEGSYSCLCPTGFVGDGKTCSPAGDLAAGSTHACALSGDGKLYCWGANDFGQVGDGTGIDRPAPAQVGNESDWKMVSVNERGTCGIRGKGSLWCWGAALDFISEGNFLQPYLVGASAEANAIEDWVVISVGEQHACGIRADGSLWCANYSDFKKVESEHHWISVTAGAYHTCAIRDDASLWCWGQNLEGELGLGTLDGANAPTEAAGKGHWVMASASAFSTCAIRNDGARFCWGGNASYTLGNGSTTDAYAPTVAGALNDWTRIAQGGAHGCGLRGSKLACWGTNDRGQVGSERDFGPVSQPIPIGPDSEWSSVSVSGDPYAQLSCARRSDGSVWCWGANDRGQLGTGVAFASTTPRKVETGQAAAVVASGDRACSLSIDGSLSCWGRDQPAAPQEGQPLDIAPPKAWASVALGTWHACGTKLDGTLWCWGENAWGQLGNSGYAVEVPTAVKDAPSLQTLAAGATHTCGISQSEKLFCWGGNELGQLGNGKHGVANGSIHPLEVDATTSWAHVTAGVFHTCGIRADGRLACWGSNGNAQLGNGKLPDLDATAYQLEDSPVLIGGFDDWAAISSSASSNHTCAIRDSGALFCWGANNTGQCGLPTYLESDGAIVDTSLLANPSAVLPDELWRSVSTGGNHSCAIRTNGSLWCWGDNGDGQLGNGSRSSSDAPQEIGSELSWTEVSLGDRHSCARQADGSTWCWGADDWGQLGLGDSWKASPQKVLMP